MCCECNENTVHIQLVCIIICIIHIAGISLCLISVSLYSSNVNTNASESLQTSYDHYKCLANNKNGLRLVTNILRMVTNMLRICFLCELCKSSTRYHCFPWPIILFSGILVRNSNFLQFSHSQGKILLFDAYETCYS